MIIYWCVVLFVGIKILPILIDTSKRSNTVSRKYFHGLALIMFIPGLILYPNFLSLSYGVALAILLIVEMCRYAYFWPFGDTLNEYMSSFKDEKDVGNLVITHIYLLLGCAIPLWIY